MKRILFVVAVGVVSALGVVAARQAPARPSAAPADLVLRNGKIITVDDAKPQGQAVAVTGGKVTFVGSNAEIAAYVGPQTQVIDLAGATAIPGFIEGHGHFTGVGEAKLGLELMPTKSWDEIVAMVGDAAKKARPGQWIVGRGWHQEKWSKTPTPNVEGFPMHASLDAVSPNNPVILTHASGHASFANGLALKLSGVTKDTANPNGGEILRDKDGNPTGLLRERASGLIKRGAGEPAPTAAENAARNARVLELADQEVASKGITSFHDAGSSFGTVESYKAAYAANTLHAGLAASACPPGELTIGSPCGVQSVIPTASARRLRRGEQDEDRTRMASTRRRSFDVKETALMVNGGPGGVRHFRGGVQERRQGCGGDEGAALAHGCSPRPSWRSPVRWASASMQPVLTPVRSRASIGEAREERRPHRQRDALGWADTTTRPSRAARRRPRSSSAIQKMTRMEALLKSYTINNAFEAFEESRRARSRTANSPTSCRRTSRPCQTRSRTAKIVYTIVGSKIV